MANSDSLQRIMFPKSVCALALYIQKSVKINALVCIKMFLFSKLFLNIFYRQWYFVESSDRFSQVAMRTLS